MALSDWIDSDVPGALPYDFSEWLEFINSTIQQSQTSTPEEEAEIQDVTNAYRAISDVVSLYESGNATIEDVYDQIYQNQQELFSIPGLFDQKFSELLTGYEEWLATNPYEQAAEGSGSIEQYAAENGLTPGGFTLASGQNVYTDEEGNTYILTDDGAGNITKTLVYGSSGGWFDKIINGIEGIADAIFGGDPSVIQIPIPGMPISIPGNISWEDLLVIAEQVSSATGRTIEEVVSDITETIENAGAGDVLVDGNGDGIDDRDTDGDGVLSESELGSGDSAPTVSDEASCGIGQVAVPNEDGTFTCVSINADTGTDIDQPTGNIFRPSFCPSGYEDENGTCYPSGYPGLPGTSQSEMPEDSGDSLLPGGTGDDLNEDPLDTPFPGLPPTTGGGDLNDDRDQYQPTLFPGPAGGGQSPGASGGSAADWAWLPGLFALASDDSDPFEFTPKTYQGPDTSYGYESPDYGEPDMASLFDFGEQSNQPIQVGYNVQSRRPVISPVERERRRRMQRGLL